MQRNRFFEESRQMLESASNNNTSSTSSVNSFVASFQGKPPSDADLNLITAAYYNASDAGNRDAMKALCSVKGVHPDIMPSRDSVFGPRGNKL